MIATPAPGLGRGRLVPMRPLSAAWRPRVAFGRPAVKRPPLPRTAASSAGAADAFQWAGEPGQSDGNGADTQTPRQRAAGELALADLLPEEAETRPAWLIALHRAAPFLASRDLLRRVLGTLTAVAVVRVGAFVPLPGAAAAAPAPATAAGASLDTAFGGDGGVAGTVSALALGVGPAINAGWLLMAASLNFPGNPCRRFLQELRQGGREGAAELKVYSNVITAAIALFAGWRTAVECVPPGRVAAATLTLAAGAVAIRYIADWIEGNGLGDGMSLMICISVLTGFGGNAARALAAARAAAVAPGVVAAVAGACVALVYAGIYVTQLEMRLPLVSYRRRRAGTGASPRPAGVGGAPESDGAARAGASLPLRIAPGGMAPLLMASLAYHLVPSAVGLINKAAAAALSAWLARPVVGPAVMASLIVLGEAASVAGSEAPKEMADWMASAETGLAGTPPGEDTERRLRTLTAATRLAGGALLAGLYLAAAAVDSLCSAALGGGAAPGAVSLLLAAGFVTSAARQVSSLVRMPVLADALAAERRELRQLLVVEGGAKREPDA